ncbi:HdeD family acid-resistance protein [Enterococcus sp. LJL51]|uniref:HdeD family acid-resistance protein n=1 Tax=Enterococcus sp. LJL51 TaxID=3416656 RepID=UPI003CE85A23
MNETRNNGIDWGSLLLGILFVLTALLSFQDPAGNLIAIVMVFAVFAIFKGIFELIGRNRLKQLTGYRAYAPIVLGVIDMIIGIYFLFNLGVGVSVLPYIFAIWFIVDSVFGLFTLELARAFNTGYYWFTLIVDILGIILGFILLFNPLSSALTLSFLVGFYFMMFGITHIVYAFRS